jgi:hypothetical protein
VAGGDGGGFTAVGRSQLGQDVRDVRAGGAGADEQLGGDLWIGQPLTEQPENLSLAAGEGEGIGRRRNYTLGCRCAWRLRRTGKKGDGFLQGLIQRLRPPGGMVCLKRARSQRHADRLLSLAEEARIGQDEGMADLGAQSLGRTKEAG